MHIAHFITEEVMEVCTFQLCILGWLADSRYCPAERAVTTNGMGSTYLRGSYLLEMN